MNNSNFRNFVLVCALSGVIAGCSQGTMDAADATAQAAAADAAGGFGASPLASGMLAGRAPREGYASLPDRGDLVGYPAERVVRKDGPYTWHRADLSEEHALAAIVDGVLTLTTPSGEQLQFQYDRHVEHDSGDWTWIGHVLGGNTAEDAIITFGAGAVFGTIARPGKSALNLAMRDDASWLVETDRAALAAASLAAGRYAQPDFVVPPVLDGENIRHIGMQAQAMGPSEAAADATTYVDVLVGYTAGFREQHTVANVPAVSSRLNFLTEVANESYANSGLDMRVRLVHTMEVNYADATGNSAALYALSGSEGSTPVPGDVDAALQPLHAAREQYGADLVMLIRSFNHPENVSCGVAWLIGGGQTETHAGYGVFGFSVVSDGTDGGFFCEDTTFAHELGHNMGLAHDIDTSKGDDGVLQQNEYGRFADSFGLRTSFSQGNFYTVMAYDDTQVIGYKVFSTPLLNFCGGFACGVANQADNTKTLQTTGPIVASFRAAVVTEPPAEAWVRNDFNGDGKADLLWRRSTTGQNLIWRSGSASTTQAVGALGDLGWQVVGVGDFDGNGKGDIFWRKPASGQNVLWLEGDRNQPVTLPAVAPAAWEVAGVGDFDGDGVSDAFWRNGSTGQNSLWLGVDEGEATDMPAMDAAWDVAGVGDFNADGIDDLLWRNGATGENTAWLGGAIGETMTVRVLGLAWRMAAVADLDGDGADDIIWRNTNSGANVVWRSGNALTPVTLASVADQVWQVETSGDFNGDGDDDLVWRNSATGANRLWPSGNAVQAEILRAVGDLSWQVVN